MDIAERRLPQDGRMNLLAGNVEIDVRVSTIPTVCGESISLRLLSRGEQQFGFDRLDLGEKAGKNHSSSTDTAKRDYPAYGTDRLWEVNFALLLP